MREVSHGSIGGDDVAVSIFSPLDALAIQEFLFTNPCSSLKDVIILKPELLNQKNQYQVLLSSMKLNLFSLQCNSDLSDLQLVFSPSVVLCC